MTTRDVLRLAMIPIALLPAVAGQTVIAAESGGLPQPLGNHAPWQPVAGETAKAQALAWLSAMKADPAAWAKAEAIWADLPSPTSEDDLLARLSHTFAVADPRASKLVAMCSRPRSQFAVAKEAWLRDPATPPLLGKNLRLYYARWLVQESLFDEAQEQLEGLSAGEVVAPAALLFCQSVVHHAFLNKESGLKSIGELLRGAAASPRRYVAIARLMQDDLNDLEDDTLDHIARRMDDIRRRLELGRAGKKVREVEDGVIKSLDKLIKKLEDQQQQQQSAGAQNMRPSNPAQESRIAEGKGPGEVTKRNIGSESGWGDLPPKEREEAMQQVGRDFPSHYRDAIEQYFRRLAAEDGENRDG